MNRYLDANGLVWLLVAETRAGKYGWFRPVEQADNVHADQNFPMTAMRNAEFVARHKAALQAHVTSMLQRDPQYRATYLNDTLVDIAVTGAGGAL